MEALLTYWGKSALILVLFWICYRTLLSKTTFFNLIRAYFIAGLLLSAFLPLWEIVHIREVEIPVNLLSGEVNQDTAVAGTQGFNPLKGLSWVYIGGALLFGSKILMQFLSLFKILRQGERRKEPPFTYIKTRKPISPFSFFRYIVYHPGTPDPEALEAVLEHERKHARDLHSADILLGQLYRMFFWFNPLTWIYLKDLNQNLEFLADRKSLHRCRDLRTYQLLLLKQSIGPSLEIINPFYTSSIKKRIVMLQQKQSTTKQLLRFIPILPLMLVFFLLFQVRTEARYKLSLNSTETISSQQSQNIYALNKDMTDADLNALKAEVTASGGKLQLKKIKRNSSGMIIALALKFEIQGSMVEGRYDNPEGIETVYFGTRPSGGIFLSQGELHQQQRLHIIREGEPSEEVETITITEGDHPAQWVEKKGEEIHVKVITLNDSIGSQKIVINGLPHGEEFSWTPGAPQSEENVIIWNGDKSNGKSTTLSNQIVIRSDAEDIITLNDSLPQQVKFIFIDTRGDSVSTGAIGKNQKVEKVIIHKSDVKAGEDKQVVKIKTGKAQDLKWESDDLTTGGMNFEGMLIFIDDRESTSAAAKALKPEQIERMEVFKGEKARSEYGEKAAKGVIKIYTKKS